MITPASPGDWIQALAMAGAVGGFVAAFMSMLGEEAVQTAPPVAPHPQPVPVTAERRQVERSLESVR